MPAAVLGLALAFTAPAAAHHGWQTYDRAESSVGGFVEAVDLRGPHGQIRIRNAEGAWNVILLSPEATVRSGLTLEAIPVATRITVHGHRRTDRTREIQAKRLVVGPRTYDFYPDRRRSASKAPSAR